MNNENEYIEFLKNYLNEMTFWETKWGEILKTDPNLLFSNENILLRKNELEGIFNKYLSKQALQKGQSRLINLSFQDPPSHKVELIKIEEKKDRFSIYVRNEYFEHESRFDLIKEDEKIKLHSKAFDFENWKTQKTIF